MLENIVLNLEDNYLSLKKEDNHNKKQQVRLAAFFGSLSKRTDAKILIIIFKLLDESLIVFFVLSREENYIIL